MSSPKQYDIILFGCTGFTGKLAVEYLWNKTQSKDESGSSVSWAVSARNKEKAQEVLDAVIGTIKDEDMDKDKDKVMTTNKAMPDILVADLICSTPEQEEILRQVVQQTKVVLTCSGPFEKYGTTLVKLCAELGVHYADITGETDFVRSMIQKYDRTARETGATIVPHCGNDCIPQDVTVYEIYKYATARGCTLRSVQTYVEFPEDAQLSGGTAATATYQLGKPRTATNTTAASGSSSDLDRPEFDPMLTTASGTKSEFATKNITPKTEIDMPEFESKAGYVMIHSFPGKKKDGGGKSIAVMMVGLISIAVHILSHPLL